MQKLSKSQSGFTHLLLILVGIVTISGVGAASMLVVKHHHDSQEQQKLAAQKTQQLQTQQTTPAAKATPEPTKTTAPTPQAASPCTPDKTMYVNVSDGLNLRQEKSLSSAKVVLMPYRAAITAGCLDGDWYTAIYNGHTGYANKAYVSATKPAAAADNTSPKTGTAAPTVTPSTITIGGKSLSCSTLSSATFMASTNPTLSYDSPNGGQKSSYPKYTVLTGLSCATTEGWVVKNGNEYFKSQDLSLTA